MRPRLRFTTTLLLPVLLALAAAPRGFRVTPAWAHGDAAEREAEISALLLVTTDDAFLRLERGRLRQLSGDLEGADEDYRAADALAPQVPGVPLCRASLALERGDAAAAVTFLERCLAADASNARAWDLLATAHAALDDSIAAARDLDRAIALDRHPSPDLFLRRSRLPGGGDAVHARGASPDRGHADGDVTEPPVLLRGPYLQSGTPGAFTVCWRTDRASASCVRFGSAPGALDSMVLDPAPVTEHVVRVTGLAPATRYHYSIGTDSMVLAGDDSAHHAVTAPEPGSTGPVRVWVIGDSGLPGATQSAVRDAYYAFSRPRPADLWLMLGDNAYGTGTDGEYQAAVFEAYRDILRTTVLWPTRGNHDLLYSGSGNDYYDIFSLPASGECGGVASGTEAYYAFDHGNIHFVCLDSQGSSRQPGGAMAAWLESDLAATPADWIIAFWHHPPYTKGSHDSDTETALIEMRENILPILEDGGVDLVLCGHSHSYERSRLLDRHYGASWTLANSMVVDTGDGSRTGDGAYVTPVTHAGGHDGTVYAVAGSSSRTGGGSLDHPVMVRSLDVPGSLVLDIHADELDATFIDDEGVARDDFAIVHAAITRVPGAAGEDHAAGAMGLRASPSPFSRATRIGFELARSGPVLLVIHDAGGREVRRLADGIRDAGHHALAWDGMDGTGRPVPPGMYFTRLVAEGRSTTGKVILVR